MIIAAPTDSVEVGDVLVMRRNGSATITHRVVRVEKQAGARYAVTQGDANIDRDIEPYRLGEEELVARWTISHLGSILTAADDSTVRFAMVAIVMVILAGAALGRIWMASPPLGKEAQANRPDGPLLPREVTFDPSTAESTV